MKILIVEDDLINVELFTAILEHAGHEIKTKLNGQDIIEDTIAFDPDVIVMDINLPGKNGDELMFMLREDTRTANHIIVAVTANAMKHDRGKYLDMGFDGYIPKPINVATFANELMAYLA